MYGGTYPADECLSELSFLPLVYGLRNSVQINQPSGFQLETAKKAGLKAVNNESITDAEKQNS
ncbi:hypothetical protein Bca52824_082213 [Brassica carinata]|uniref:Uncharacterized protein n=1 Tax=Brassica carinata TaxID=52824 RepID=A0A8X7TRY6_BRACI|nr:hypothetical protein Bca52824_082213 [Brassica carinata]